MAVVLLVILAISLNFLQLGFVPIDRTGTFDVYAILLLAPPSLAALLLGTIAGFVLGVVTGTVLCIHSIVMPLDFQELKLVTPITSMGMFSVYGLIIGVMFALLLPRMRSCVSIVLSCFLVALAGSVTLELVSFYDPTGIETLLQVVVDTAITAIPCLFARKLTQVVRERLDDIGVREAFRMTIFVVVLLAFLITITISYVTVTLGELESANAAIKSEVNYICLQLESTKQRAAAFEKIGAATGHSLDEVKTLTPDAYEILDDSVGSVLEGYTMEQTGTVAIIDDGCIIVTDDSRLPVGSDVRELLGDEIWKAIEQSVQSGEVQRIIYSGVLTSGDNAGGYDNTMQVAYLLAGQQGDHIVMIIEPSSMVFRDRLGVMGREVVITLILLSVVFVVVTRLLSTMVARRIDQTNEALACITSGDLDVRCEVAGTREFKSLSEGTNKTVDALKRLIAEAEHRIEADLATGRAIQEGSLPKQFPAFPDVEALDLFASMDAAKEVGGDFYDFFSIDANTVAFLVADVSGKGIPGALFMMAAKAEIQSCLSSGMGMDDALTSANKYLCTHNDAGMFVTVWAAVLDWHTGQLTYVNAGHNYPLLRHGRGGSWEWLKERSGPFMGGFDMATYRPKSLVLEPGDELLLYTDGVNEAFSVDDEEYGNQRLERFLSEHIDERPHEVVQGLRKDVAAWAEGAEQSDDITILALEYKGWDDAPQILEQLPA